MIVSQYSNAYCLMALRMLVPDAVDVPTTGGPPMSSAGGSILDDSCHHFVHKYCVKQVATTSIVYCIT